MGSHQLHRVGITRQYDDVYPLVRSLMDQSTDDIVSLVSVQLVGWDTEGIAYPAHVLELAPQLLGGSRPLGLILLELQMAKGGCWPIEGDNPVGRV